MGLSVRLSVITLALMLALGQEPLEIGSCNLVCGMSMKIKTIHIFISCPSDFFIVELMPFLMFFQC